MSVIRRKTDIDLPLGRDLLRQSAAFPRMVMSRFVSRAQQVRD